MKKRLYVLVSMILIVCLLAGCSKDAAEDSQKTATGVSQQSEDKADVSEASDSAQSTDSTQTAAAPADNSQPDAGVVTQEAEPVQVQEPEIPEGAFDKNGGVVAIYGTPVVDGMIDEVWDTARTVVPTISSSTSIKAEPEFKVLWDDECLYILGVVKDPVLDCDSNSTYMQDSVEIFLDELYDAATTYQDDDVQFRVNYENFQSADHGDITRFTSAANVTTDDAGTVTGYVIEASITFTEAPSNGQICGFDLQVNDANANSARNGTITLFDASGNAYQDPSLLGSVVFFGKKGGEVKIQKSRLKNMIASMGRKNLDIFVNANILTDAVEAAKVVLDSEAATQADVDNAIAAMEAAYKALDDGSGFVQVTTLEAIEEIPDPFVFADGSVVNSKADWERRAKEISDMYSYYMYGVWRDGSDEKVTYQYDNGKLTIFVKRLSTGAETSFTATVQLPTDETFKPETGSPVVVGMHAGVSEAVANKNGFATITLDGFAYPIASDDYKHNGAFYELYPYGESWEEQTGVLMAWSWGCSKVLDALEAGLGAELKIDPTNSIVTGVSRWGKASAVCGAYEKRFKMAAPSCSGAGGLALLRYYSQGNTFDFSTKGVEGLYTYTANEPLSSLQADGEKGWFNDNFSKLSKYNYAPFDQHELASLVADENRYLFIIGSCVSEDWVNAPSMWMSYLGAKKVFDFLGLGDRIMINIHKEGHAVIPEDMEYMTQFMKQEIYGIKSELDFSNLQTSVFDLEVNKDPVWDTFTDGWKH